MVPAGQRVFEEGAGVGVEVGNWKGTLERCSRLVPMRFTTLAPKSAWLRLDSYGTAFMTARFPYQRHNAQSWGIGSPHSIGIGLRLSLGNSCELSWSGAVRNEAILGLNFHVPLCP